MLDPELCGVVNEALMVHDAKVASGSMPQRWTRHEPMNGKERI